MPDAEGRAYPPNRYGLYLSRGDGDPVFGWVQHRPNLLRVHWHHHCHRGSDGRVIDRNRTHVLNANVRAELGSGFTGKEGLARYGKETRGRDLRVLDPDGHTFAATGI